MEFHNFRNEMLSVTSLAWREVAGRGTWVAKVCRSLSKPSVAQIVTGESASGRKRIKGGWSDCDAQRQKFEGKSHILVRSRECVAHSIPFVILNRILEFADP